MLAPLIFELLVVALLMLLVGWVSDAARASAHDGQRNLDSAGPHGWNRMSRPWNPLPAGSSFRTDPIGPACG